MSHEKRKDTSRPDTASNAYAVSRHTHTHTQRTVTPQLLLKLTENNLFIAECKQKKSIACKLLFCHILSLFHSIISPLIAESNPVNVNEYLYRINVEGL